MDRHRCLLDFHPNLDLKNVSKCVRLIARLDIFLSIQFELLISHLEFVKLVRNVILSAGLIVITKFFVEKTRKEKMRHFKIHVQSR